MRSDKTHTLLCANFLPEYVLPFADDNESLILAIIGINIFQRGGNQFFGELGRQPNWKRHATFKDGIGHWPIVVVVIIIVSHLKYIYFDVSKYRVFQDTYNGEFLQRLQHIPNSSKND